MTVLAGQAAIEAQSLEDEEIVNRCMSLLRKMFPEKVSERTSQPVHSYPIPCKYN